VIVLYNVNEVKMCLGDQFCLHLYKAVHFDSDDFKSLPPVLRIIDSDSFLQCIVVIMWSPFQIFLVPILICDEIRLSRISSSNVGM
jgi:hypothetical protein